MSDDILDLKEFLERVQDDKDLLLELIDIFADDYKGKRQLLEKAITANDCVEVRNVAHSLKGASGNISAKRLRPIFMQMEDMGKAGDVAPAQGLLADLDKEYLLLSQRFEKLHRELR